ncbi:thiopeptide-type bacteriocin [Streptomyces cellostaticus]|uniref:thiopeptide-type bacteriocin n=1 Tax=Streptomyces cellostaticus TaxID=67285 RepID=UPI0037D99AF3
MRSRRSPRPSSSDAAPATNTALPTRKAPHVRPPRGPPRPRGPRPRRLTVTALRDTVALPETGA